MRLKIILAAALVFAVASAAMAQYESSQKSRIGIGMALFKPTSSVLKGIRSTWSGPTIDINLTYDEFDRPKAFATIGFFSQDSNMYRASLTPVTATYIKRFGTDPASCWYVGGGLGAYLVKFQRTWPSTSGSATKYGFHLVAGRELGGFYYVNFRYDMVDKLGVPGFGEVDFSGWSVGFGTRYTF